MPFKSKEESKKYFAAYVRTPEYRAKAKIWRSSPKRKAYQKKYVSTPQYQAYRKEYNKRVSARYGEAHANRRKALLDLMGGKCKRCDFSDYRALQIDHVNGGGSKERKRTDYNTKKHHEEVTKSILNKEQKYQLLCANCNWIKRFEMTEHRKTHTEA